MQPPDAATLDYVVFSVQAGGPLNITPSDLREQIYYVRGYSDTSALRAGSIDTQISALLHHGTLNVTGYTVMSINRESDFQFVENLPNSDKVYCSGGFYRISLDGS